jgi:hypothetical protein
VGDGEIPRSRKLRQRVLKKSFSDENPFHDFFVSHPRLLSNPVAHPPATVGGRPTYRLQAQPTSLVEGQFSDTPPATGRGASRFKAKALWL